MVPLLLQTSLLLWLAQLTLQGGVKPQSVSWGRVLPARGVGVGAKPAGVGALGVMANRYGSKAMKSAVGQYPASTLGAGGVGSLGLGSRGGLQQGYGSQGLYGPGLGNGIGLRTDLANGLGLGQGVKPGYGAAAGAYPVNGGMGGLGYRTPQPGSSSSSSSSLAQPGQDLGKAKLKGLGYQYGADKLPDLRRGGSPTVPELLAGSQFRPTLLPERKVKSLDQSGLGPRMTDLQNKPLAKSGELPVPKMKSSDFLSSGGLRQQGLVQNPVSSQVQRLRSYPTSVQQSKSNWYQERQGSASRRPLVPQQQLSKDQKPYAGTSYQTQWNTRSQGSPVPQRPQIYSSAVEERQRGLAHAGRNYHRPEALGSQGQYGLRQAASQGTNLGVALAGTQKVKSKDVTDVSQRGLDGSRSLGMLDKTGGNNQAARYFGGAGNYLGANPGAMGYGAGLTPGGYLGGAAGKQAAGLGVGSYPQGVRGYDEGAAGYQGAMDANGYGYGNGYSDGYRAALNSRGYAGQSQGAYGALGTGLEPTGGKYAGAGQVPYGGTAMIPSGLEGDGGYQYGPQQLSLTAEGSKSASKQGYGVQLGATQAALGEQAGKYNGGNGALANGFKG